MAGSQQLIINSINLNDKNTVEEYLDKINNDNIANFQTHNDKVVEIKLDGEIKKYKLGRIIKLWKIINDASYQDPKEEYDFCIKNNNNFFIEYDAIKGIIPPEYNIQSYIYLYKMYEVIVDNNNNNVVSYKPAKMIDLTQDVRNNISDKIIKPIPDEGSDKEINEFLQAYRINNIHPANRKGNINKDYYVGEQDKKYVYGIWKKDGGILKYLSVTHMINTRKFKVEWKDAKLH